MRSLRIFIVAAALLTVSSPARAECTNTGSFTCPSSATGSVAEGQLQALTVLTGYANTARLVSAANSDNPTVAKASAGWVVNIKGYNAASAVRYLKIYNKATGPSAADTPRETIPLPPSAAFAFDYPIPMTMTAGISYRLVTGSADNDNTAVTLNDVVGLNIGYN